MHACGLLPWLREETSFRDLGGLERDRKRIKGESNGRPILPPRAGRYCLHISPC